jgi:hypothetical protein
MTRVISCLLVAENFDAGSIPAASNQKATLHSLQGGFFHRLTFSHPEPECRQTGRFHRNFV